MGRKLSITLPEGNDIDQIKGNVFLHIKGGDEGIKLVTVLNTESAKEYIADFEDEANVVPETPVSADEIKSKIDNDFAEFKKDGEETGDDEDKDDDGDKGDDDKGTDKGDK